MFKTQKRINEKYGVVALKSCENRHGKIDKGNSCYVSPGASKFSTLNELEEAINKEKTWSLA
jgi:hypothetical protein